MMVIMLLQQLKAEGAVPALQPGEETAVKLTFNVDKS